MKELPYVLQWQALGAALALDLDTTVALQGKAVYLALKGYTDHVPEVGGFAPISKLISDFIEFGGKLLVCKPCIEERKIEDTAHRRS
ncbi:DsrE family protein [Desulfobacula sp.]